MEEEEIERHTAALRELLIRNGFDWAVMEAEDALYPTVAPRTRLLALIDAAEGVTIDLAEIEIRTLDFFEAEDLQFKPDEEDQADTDIPRKGADAALYSSDADLPRGAQRRALLVELAGRRSAFDMLRRHLDGLD